MAEMKDKIVTAESLKHVHDSLRTKMQDFIPTEEKGKSGGVAELDEAGKVLSSQLPSDLAKKHDIPDSLENPHPLAINGMEYTGASKVDYTDAINTMIDARSSNSFYITATMDENGNTGTVDKTDAEIEEAYNAGDLIYLLMPYGGGVPITLPLISTVPGDEYDPRIWYFSITALDPGSGIPNSCGVTLWDNQVRMTSTVPLATLDDIPEVPTIPSALKNPNALTINGTEYDGSKAVSVFTSDGKSVLFYGAKGDGTTDDTIAFQNALAENRLVYVPEGTYKLSGTLLVEENCELELAQSAVLNFTQIDSPCITLLRVASLRGNHATILVPYEFSSKVINCDTRECIANLGIDSSLTGSDRNKALSAANRTAVPPFTHWDPQWKMSRYVTDINICKPNSSGLMTCGSDLTGYGSAVYMGCYEDTQADYMWGVSMSGLRIAGGFAYGIQIENEGSTWNHDMRIEAVIEGCEIGVSTKNCNIAHLAVTIQPKPYAEVTYNSDGTSTTKTYPYAKYGIRLEDSKWIDLSSSYVWDWTSRNSLVGTNPEYQHIAMYGDCSGVNIYDASLTNSNGFWQKIYYDNPASMLNATVHGAKGKIPIDPKYAFYKNYRSGAYEFMNQNLTWRDYHNMVRYDVPVLPKNAYNNKNRLYKIGYFTINGPCENIIEDDPNTTDTNEYTDDLLTAETITIEENNLYGLLGWSNLYCAGSAVKHYWSPLPSNYDSRVPIYFYSKSGSTYTIYRLVGDNYDIQHIHNCRVSITNARRFIFDYVDMGEISTLDTNTYIRITPEMQSGSPKIAGQYGLVDGKPIICTKSSTWSAQGAVSTAATTKELAFKEDLDNIDVNLDDYFNTGTVKGFADVLSTAIDFDGSVYNGVGYKTGVRLTDSQGLSTTESAFYGVTGLFPCKKGDTIYAENLSWAHADTNCRIVLFDSDFNYVLHINAGNLTAGNNYYVGYTATENGFICKLNNISNLNDVAYARFGLYKTDFGTNPIIAVNEEIKYSVEGFLSDNIKVKGENIIMTSPNGTAFKLFVSDDGVLSAKEYNS